jgi:hypothetical protein
MAGLLCLRQAHQEGTHRVVELRRLLVEGPVAGSLDDDQPAARDALLQVAVILHGGEPVLRAAEGERGRGDLPDPRHRVEGIVGDPVGIGDSRVDAGGQLLDAVDDRLRCARREGPGAVGGRGLPARRGGARDAQEVGGHP